MSILSIIKSLFQEKQSETATSQQIKQGGAKLHQNEEARSAPLGSDGEADTPKKSDISPLDIKNNLGQLFSLCINLIGKLIYFENINKFCNSKELTKLLNI